MKIQIEFLCGYEMFLAVQWESVFKTKVSTLADMKCL